MKDIHKLLLLSTLLSLCSLCACASPPTKQARLKAYAEALELQVKQVEDKPLQSEILVHSIDRDLKTLVDGAADMKDAEADVAVQYPVRTLLPHCWTCRRTSRYSKAMVRQTRKSRRHMLRCIRVHGFPAATRIVKG
jgi:hypothetical protein